MNLTDFAESGLAHHFFRTATFPKPPTIAIALTKNVPLDSYTGSLGSDEVGNANGYARQLLAPLDANWTYNGQVQTSGNVDNASAITFGPCTTADWGWVSGVAICNSGVYGAGDALLVGPLATPKYIGVGDSLVFSIGSLDVYFG